MIVVLKVHCLALETELASGSVSLTVSVVVILAAWLFVVDLILE